MRLAVLGTGYVGLVAGACFADFGNDVVCVDIDAEKVARLGRGICPSTSPGSKSWCKRNVEAERLSFTTDIDDRGARRRRGLHRRRHADGDDGSADLSHVLGGRRGDRPRHHRLHRRRRQDDGARGHGGEDQGRHRRGSPQQPFAVVTNPEFLKEGDAVDDFMKPDRVIIGSDDSRAIEVLRQLYAPFVRTDDRILLMDAISPSSPSTPRTPCWRRASAS